MANRIKKKKDTAVSVQSGFATIMGIFVIAVLCVLPVMVTNSYFNILETKYITYCVMSITMMSVMFLYGLAKGRVAEFFKNFNLIQAIKGLSFVDWAMIVFWIANVISWIFSYWRWEAFWGTSGRFNGVFLMTIYMVVYFLTTRFFVFRRWYLDAFLAVGLFICLFGITDYFKMDIFGMKVRVVDYQKDIYTSTIGNINTYTIYAAVYLIISMILFTQENNRKKMFWYYGNMIISSFALIMGVSDNAYLSLAALFGLTPLYLFRSKQGLSRYLISLATFFTVILCIDGINTVFADTVIGIKSAFTLIAGLSILPAIVIGLWAVAGGFTYWVNKGKKNGMSDDMGKGLSLAWIGVIVLVVGAVAFAFYDATVLGHSERYGALASYVTFNEHWGTDRGYIWNATFTLWEHILTPFQKVFGLGADTFRLLMMSYYPPRQVGERMVVFDSVHNEYLNHLVTIGIVGMVAHIMFLLSAIVTMCKRMKGRPEVAAVMFAIAAYAVQATININLPVAYPVILMLLTMGLSKTPDMLEKSE